MSAIYDKIIDGAAAVSVEDDATKFPQVLSPEQFRAVLATPVLRELHDYADRFIPLRRLVTGGKTTINGVS